MVTFEQLADFFELGHQPTIAAVPKIRTDELSAIRSNPENCVLEVFSL
jgi:hypothetical protein